MKPRLRALKRQVPMSQLLSWIDVKVISGLLTCSLVLEDARRTLVHDTAKGCAQALEAYPPGDVDEVAASHFLSLCQSFRALLALASDDLDGITNGLDDLVALQDLSLTSKRTALLDVKITVQATECWRDRFEGRISNAAAYAELGPCFRRCTTLLASDFTSDWAQDMSTLDRVPGDLRLLQQSLTTEVVTECLTEFQGRVSKCWGNLWEACDTQGPGALATETAAAEGFRACVPAAHQTPRHPCRVGHDRPRARRAEGREVLSAGTANIFGRLSFRHAGQRHGRLDDEVHFVRECGGRSTPQCS